MSIYHKYAPDGKTIFVLSDIDDFAYRYTSESLGKHFLDALGKKFNVNFLGYAHWFMSIIIFYIKDHSISVDQDIYDTSIVAKCLDIVTVKTSAKFYNTNLPSDMIFTKSDASISVE